MVHHKIKQNQQIGDRINGLDAFWDCFINKCPKCSDLVYIPTLKYADYFCDPIIDGDKNIYKWNHCNKCWTNLYIDIKCYMCDHMIKFFKRKQLPIICIERKCIQKHIKLIESIIEPYITNNIMQLISQFIFMGISDD